MSDQNGRSAEPEGSLQVHDQPATALADSGVIARAGDKAAGTVLVTTERPYGWRLFVGIPALVAALGAVLVGMALVGSDLLLRERLVSTTWWTVAAFAAVAALVFGLLGHFLISGAPRRKIVTQRLTGASALFYLAFLVGVVVSADTSWRFFEHKAQINSVAERIAMFAGLEIMLLAAGFAMRRGMVLNGKPGPARYLTWGLCGLSAVFALILAGWPIGPARVLAGPFLATVALHYALGVELRDRRASTQRTRQAAVTLLGRVFQELQERTVSRLGLADDRRSALQRTRERAADRAARLGASTGGGWLHRRRVARALRVGNVAHDPAMRDRMIAALAIERAASTLHELETPSPWVSLSTSEKSAADSPEVLSPVAKLAETEVLGGAGADHADQVDQGAELVGQATSRVANQPDRDTDHVDQAVTDGPAHTDSVQLSRWANSPGPVVSDSTTASAPALVGPTADNGYLGDAAGTTSTISTSQVARWPGGAAAHLKSVDPTDEAAHRPSGASQSSDLGSVPPLPTKGLAKEQIALLLKPVASQLVRENDFLSRQDVINLTEVTSSTTAGQIRALISQEFPGHPEPNGRRKPDRNRTIADAVQNVHAQRKTFLQPVR